ncbi:MAG: hypothetical protein Q4D04_14535, partial [Clostridia bacterium]|nr:hypothetical protein [Clostridia bacterium]
MAWIELHQTRARHPKTLRLAALIKKDRRYACGLLDDLWLWALDAADRDGKLKGVSREDMAVALDLSGKEGTRVVAALIASGYVEESENGEMTIHDWYDYTGKLNDKRSVRREQTRERQRRLRARTETDASAQDERAKDAHGSTRDNAPDEATRNALQGRDNVSDVTRGGDECNALHERDITLESNACNAPTVPNRTIPY